MPQRTVKFSRQREAIKIYLRDHPVHPTADEIYTAIRQSYPSISLATVYRNLHQLTDSGEIRKISFVAGSDHFDYDTSQHDHYVCLGCGRVYDMPKGTAERINEAIEGECPGTIESHDLVFYGRCRACTGQ